MDLPCPDCRRPIPLEDVHVSKDIALCRGCGRNWSYAALVAGERLDQGVDLLHPPPGAWQRGDAVEAVIGATHRSWGPAAFSLGIAAFWNGIVSVFVLVAAGETLKRLGVAWPGFLPMPKMEDGDGVNSWGLAGLWLFLTPFMAVGAGLVGNLALTVAGRTEVRIAGGTVEVFTGVGPVGRRRRFEACDAKDVRLDETSSGRGEDASVRRCIGVDLEGGRVVRFGHGLREDRRMFVAAALRQRLR